MAYTHAVARHMVIVSIAVDTLKDAIFARYLSRISQEVCIDLISSV